MKNQVKVNNTQQYSDSQGEHIVCKGKLILLNTCDSNFKQIEGTRELHFKKYIEELRPIIISETEEIKEGDWVYDKSHKSKIERVKRLDENNIYFEDERLSLPIKYGYKILSLPEHFSDAHLQAIVDGKLIDKSEVFINLLSTYPKPLSKHIHDLNNRSWKIYLNKQNHITLFPVKKTPDEGFEEWYNRRFPIDHEDNKARDAMHKLIMKDVWDDAIDWIKNNNY